MLSIKTILHPTDFSEPSEAAFRCACSLASIYGAQLVIVHAISIPILFVERFHFSTTNGCRTNLPNELLELKAADEQGDVGPRSEEGQPAAEILQLARLCQADLIVMGTHGRRELNRFLLGSVAGEVVREAPCPVLTVRASYGGPPAVDDLRSSFFASMTDRPRRRVAQM